MRIARDGTWYHQGHPIGREAMVRLFATVLRREPDGSHVLVTPVEKLSIVVEGTAFRALTMTMEGGGETRRIAFALDSGDAVIAGPDHPLTRHRHPRRPLPAPRRPPRARGRTVAPALLRARRHRACRGLRPARHLVERRLLRARYAAMSLVDRIAAALALARPDDLLAGDDETASTEAVREAAVLVAITDRARPRPHPHPPQPRACATMAGRSPSPAAAATRAKAPKPPRCARHGRKSPSIPRQVRILGQADHYRTITGFGVTPVVALIPPDLPLVCNPAEVDAWFEAPLDFVLDPRNQHRRAALYKGQARSYFEIVWDGHRIWGATAAMLVNLSRRAR